MRQFIFTTSLVTGLILSACSKNSPGELKDAPSSEVIAPTAETSFRAAKETQNTITGKVESPRAKADNSILPTAYQGLDPQDITRAEIDELIAIQKKYQDKNQIYIAKYKAWVKLDPASRGPAPKQKALLTSKQDMERLAILNGKLAIANLRKKYQTYVPDILSTHELNELLILEKKNSDLQAEYNKKLQAWSQQNSATRGQRPNRAFRKQTQNLRLNELKNKIRVVENQKRTLNNLNKRFQSQNISISDNELNELKRLTIEQNKTQAAIRIAAQDAQKQRQLTGVNTQQSVPAHLVQQQIEIKLRIEEIQAPLLAAEKAKHVRKNMTQLSKQTGVIMLDGEMDEAIALNAEKFEIQARAKREATQKWLIEGGPQTYHQALPNDADYARLKDIDARLKDIQAPMYEANHALEDEKNPAMRQFRIQNEARQKWNTIWTDKKQAGEIPLDAPLTSPSYAEIQDRVENYSDTLKTRANNAGYSVPQSDVKRLNTLNENMLAIRKSVYDMEVDGTSKVKTSRGYKAPGFKFSAGMYKIQLIEKKQRGILAGLQKAESYKNGTYLNQNSRNGFTSFNSGRVNNFETPTYRSGAEAMIKNLRATGVEVSQDDADELIAFERELENK